MKASGENIKALARHGGGICIPCIEGINHQTSYRCSICGDAVCPHHWKKHQREYHTEGGTE